MRTTSILSTIAAAGAGVALLIHGALALSDGPAHDPGVRTAGVPAGEPIAGLTPGQWSLFNAGKTGFNEEEGIARGLGPTMNYNSCGGCHAQPSTGGSSPPVNPQVAFANEGGARNAIPPFITRDGPVRVARFVRNPDGTPDGGVHALFTIAGHHDAPGCQLSQPDFAAAMASRNIAFRIPTPVYGAGLIEQIPDSAILANLAANAGQKRSLGILGRPNLVLAGNTVSGQPNRNGNDGTIARFGWKAQNKSLLLFSGEAYNVEMGITNELFQNERDETPGCQFAAVPNDVTNADGATPAEILSETEKFTLYMRFLAPPVPSMDQPGGSASITRGRGLFASTGCAHCHTPTLRTGNSTVAALRDQPVNLYSDLSVHTMGRNLADGISQGQAGPADFRTAPLWGLGQRIFFLHDGRTSNLVTAIQEHAGPGSEANSVINRFNILPGAQRQDLLNFLRSL
jgi:CxxC motif-containing protein (DUF1111 family)